MSYKPFKIQDDDGTVVGVPRVVVIDPYMTDNGIYVEVVRRHVDAFGRTKYVVSLEPMAVE